MHPDTPYTSWQLLIPLMAPMPLTAPRSPPIPSEATYTLLALEHLYSLPAPMHPWHSWQLHDAPLTPTTPQQPLMPPIPLLAPEYLHSLPAPNAPLKPPTPLTAPNSSAPLWATWCHLYHAGPWVPTLPDSPQCPLTAPTPSDTPFTQLEPPMPPDTTYTPAGPWAPTFCVHQCKV